MSQTETSIEISIYAVNKDDGIRYTITTPCKEESPSRRINKDYFTLQRIHKVSFFQLTSINYIIICFVYKVFTTTSAYTLLLCCSCYSPAANSQQPASHQPAKQSNIRSIVWIYFLFRGREGERKGESKCMERKFQYYKYFMLYFHFPIPNE